MIAEHAHHELAEARRERRAAEHINDLTLTLLRSMTDMSQLLIDAANTAAAAEAAAVAKIADLKNTIAAKDAEIADLKAGAVDPVADQAAVDALTAGTAALQTAIA